MTRAGPRPPAAGRDPLLAAWRAQLEGPTFQTSDAPHRARCRGGSPTTRRRPGPLVAAVGTDGELVVADGPAAARRAAGKVQGRNSTVAPGHPVPVPEGDWALTLRTTWVEPAYLEPDASWCRPGGEPASPLANGGAFGGKRRSPVPADARRLADELGRPVRAAVVARGRGATGTQAPAGGRGGRAPTGPAYCGWGRRDGGTGQRRPRGAGRPGGRGGSRAWWSSRWRSPARPTSADLRGAGWAEAAVVVAALEARSGGRIGPGTGVEVTGPSGGRARVVVRDDGSVGVEVWAGEVLDAVTLRSYCIGAVHQALGWVRSEGIAVDGDGRVLDLTVRSFGILSARDTPFVDVTLHPSDGWPVNGSDAVFAATAAAAWLADDLAPEWPTRRGRAAWSTR